MTIKFAPAVPIPRIFDVEKAKQFCLDFLGFRAGWGATMTVIDPFFNSIVFSEANDDA